MNTLHCMFKFLNKTDMKVQTSIAMHVTASRSWGPWRHAGRGLNPRRTRFASPEEWWLTPREWWQRQRRLDRNKATC